MRDSRGLACLEQGKLNIPALAKQQSMMRSSALRHAAYCHGTGCVKSKQCAPYVLDLLGTNGAWGSDEHVVQRSDATVGLSVVLAMRSTLAIEVLL